ncbi:MAG: MFS transporter [Acidobacteriaceae bacterium]
MNTASRSHSAVTAAQRKTLLAASLGWALDAFDVMLYAIVIASVMRDLGISKATAGFLNTLTLLASGIGGILFGFIADRIGRTRSLMLSILTYSICSFASGLAQSIMVLAIVRFILGLGMGGEWNTGATLVAETWPTHLRARALSMVQSSWALGYAAAALIAGLVLRYTHNWRYVFFIGVAPALITLWIRKDVPESEMWKEQSRSHPVTKSDSATARLRDLFTLLAMNFFGLFAWWGVFTWVPAYLSLPVSQGGRGLDLPLLHANWLPLSTTTILLIVLNLCGMFPGYLSYGWVADRIGRKPSFILYTGVAAALVPLYAAARNPWMIMFLGTVLAFFGTGFFSGSSIIASELFPTRIRARALGFTYNGARALSSISPFVIGKIGETRGLGAAFHLCSAGFALSALSALMVPETRGRQLE